MEILFIILLTYLFLENINKFMENYLYEQINNVAKYYIRHYKLNNKEAEVVEILTSGLLDNIILHGPKNMRLFTRTYQNIISLKNINSTLEEFENYLKDNFHSNNINDMPELYFVSYYLNHKYVTCFFTFIDSKVEIVDGSETFKSLSEKEQYTLLYKILDDLINERNDYNYSQNLDDIIFKEQIQKKILVREKFKGL